MNLVLAKTETGRALSSVFAVARDRLPGAGKVADTRKEAFEAFERAGLPHRRIEEWKYTDLRALMREVLPLAAAPDVKALGRARKALKAHTIADASALVLVDGAFVPELSDVAALGGGVSIRALRDVLENDGNDARADLLLTKTTDAMISLNAALATDGVVISVADGTALSRPIHIVHVATAPSVSAFTRSHVRIGKGARATLVESFVAAEGAKAYQVNDAVIVSVGDGAELSQVRLMADASDAVNVTSQILTVGAKVKLNLFNMTGGGGVSRLQGFITLAGEGTDLSVNGVNLLKGTQHGDTTVVVDDHRPVPLWQHMLVGKRIFDLFDYHAHGPGERQQSIVDPNLLRHAARAKEVGRNPRVIGYEPTFGPSASYYAWEAAGRPVHGIRGKT